MPVMKTFKKILLYIKKTEIIIIVLLAAIIVCVISAQIFMRYFFNRPFTWVEELSTLILIYLSFISADVVYKEKNHISVVYFVEKLSFAAQRVVNILIYLSIAFVLFMIIPGTLFLVNRQSHIIVSGTVGLSKSYYTLPVLIVFPSMLLTTFYNIFEEIEKIVTHRNNNSTENKLDLSQ